ncbi:putative 16S rRNA methyltransferase GidB [Fannyhessea vaginae PB189-T1-4]|uniref:Ribosomal RNA small subunit methyltransferase G n=1 Tax=Fannyhessea vaginae PB189-T1-4 TaxID=866774 RepID=A0ABP2J2W1_9ACTN|nr:16S rRNA (guanine(527)-N(7))-methyltransferase RsmG [Fannyhessea vaginae]EFL43545.1 putative 16S rRNA methyltransferase GidB [Fannyhessea vaginae PB189-T1-4]
MVAFSTQSPTGSLRTSSFTTVHEAPVPPQTLSLLPDDVQARITLRDGGSSERCVYTYAGKSFSEDDFKQLFLAFTEPFNVPVSNAQITALYKHYSLLVETNKSINLTRITEPLAALILHYVDSLFVVHAHNTLCATGMIVRGTAGSEASSALQQISHGSLVSFIDLGTGAGFPGIPFALLTGKSGLLVDSVKKKIACVSSFIDALDLSSSVTTSSMRFEDLPSLGYKTPLIIARAVAPIRTLLEYAAPLLTRNGILLCSKSQQCEQELLDAKTAAKLCGFEFVSRETYELPLEFGYREIVVFQKCKPATIKLPRKVGMAVHKPL